MKKEFSICMLVIAILALFVSCNPAASRLNPAESTSTHLASGLPTPRPTPAIYSAVEYLNNNYAISKASGIVSNPETGLPNPGQYYVGGTPNYPREEYDMLILDREQSRRILIADDLTDITYKQSECLPIMLRWDDVSVIDVYSYLADDTSAYKAFYYYLDESTVVIVNDAARKDEAFKKNDKAWIVVIPRGEESFYPFEIPPKGTVVSPDSKNKEDYEHYYNDLRAYFMAGFKFVPVKRPATVYEDRMKDYLKWIEWRTEHPEKYGEWKTISVPQKKTAYSGNGLWRIIDCAWCESFRDVTEKEAQSEDLSEMPLLYYQIQNYEIPKEELLEFVKWQSWSDYFEYAILTYEDVETLYSGDRDLICQRLKSPDVWFFEGELYEQETIITALPDYEIARVFSEEAFAEFIDNSILNNYVLNGKITAGRLKDIKNAWYVYNLIREEDSGLLCLKSAERVLSGFMDLYKEIRYTPDVLAGDPVWKYNENYLIGEDGPYFHLSRKTIGELEIEIKTIFTKETEAHLASILETNYDRQFDYYPWDQFSNGNLLVSIKPGYYCGQIDLFNFEYKLRDHIEIVNSDENHAEIILTARARSGPEEKRYSVLFDKENGIWHISGGTLLELIVVF